MSNLDSFELSSGLEDYTGLIKDAFFTFDAAYNNGNTCILKLVIAPDDPNIGENGEKVEFIPCGDGYEPADGGAKALKGGVFKKFNVNSAIGKLIASVKDAGQIEILGAKGTANEAAIWKGLRVTFTHKSESFKIKDKQTGELVDRETTRLLIAEIDTGEERISGSAPAAEVNDGLDPVLKGKLKALAASTDSHDAFIEKAFSELELDSDAEALVIDADFYSLVKAG